MSDPTTTPAPTSETGLKQRLQTDLVQAMRDKDELRRTTIRALVAAIRTAEVAGPAARELDEAEIQAVIRTEAKKRHESAEVFAAAGRAEKAQREREEEQVVLAYLPAQLDADALAAVVDEEVAAAAEQGRSGMAAMGQVVAAVRERVGQQASGGEVAALVRARLQG